MSLIEKTCEYCGKRYFVIPARSDSRFCCRQCLFDSRKIRYTKTCETCGKVFTTKRKNQKFCCPKCSSESQKSCKDDFGYKQRLHRIWLNMKSRCYNVNFPSYQHYGRRGIIICEEWKNSFKTFYEWSINNGYKDDLTIDRIDVNGNYCPENCRWTTYEVQSNNKTISRYVTYKNETKTIGQWAKEKGLTWDILKWRLRNNWTLEEALEMPRCKNQMDRINVRKNL